MKFFSLPIFILVFANCAADAEFSEPSCDDGQCEELAPIPECEPNYNDSYDADLGPDIDQGCSGGWINGDIKGQNDLTVAVVTDKCMLTAQGSTAIDDRPKYLICVPELGKATLSVEIGGEVLSDPTPIFVGNAPTKWDYEIVDVDGLLSLERSR